VVLVVLQLLLVVVLVVVLLVNLMGSVGLGYAHLPCTLSKCTL